MKGGENLGVVNVHVVYGNQWKEYVNATIATTPDKVFVITTEDGKNLTYPFDSVISVVVTDASGTGPDTIKVNYNTGPASSRVFEGASLFWWDEWVIVEEGTGRDILAAYRMNYISSIEVNP